MLNWLVIIAKLIALVAATIIVLICGIITYLFVTTPPLPPIPLIFADLNSGFPEKNQEILKKRLSETFPIGTPEAALIKELRAQGMTIYEDKQGLKRRAIFDRPGDVVHDIFRRTGEINWKADTSGNVTEIAGSYFIKVP